MNTNDNHWELHVQGNAGLSHYNLYPHFIFYHGDVDMADFKVRFSSKHVASLGHSEKARAAMRLKTLLRYFSGLQLITNSEYIHPDSELYYVTGDRKFRVESSPEIGLELLLDELSNPFDTNGIEGYIPRDAKMEPNMNLDFIQILIDEPLARENILLFTLAYENNLNLLVNTYKIYENVRADLQVKTNNGKVVFRNDTEYPQELVDSFSQIYDLAQFINSKTASGLLSRHGTSNTPPPNKMPTLNEVIKHLRDLVYNWMNYRCMKEFGRNYILIERIGESEAILTDEDFYDLEKFANNEKDELGDQE
ncbi:hypothetical protein [Paenibacillus alvei]|uniref:hypothetical protein n=1 Tax=Paenibacillus alvei TaxID=44250 RepID=UPI0003869EE8|nr:hypothetical protein [Paenibacillus alvei]EPY11183.1 hypothetical protein PAAL66ix_19299 [Paenibacillus alvei A6-6i-x]